jgi:hypothetical protein
VSFQRCSRIYAARARSGEGVRRHRAGGFGAEVARRENPKELIAPGMAIYMGAGPPLMYATHALEAFRQFETESANTSVAPA